MRSPEPRVILMSVALVAIGSFAGAFLDRLSFPHVAQIFTTCASSKQFIAELRMRESRSVWVSSGGASGMQMAVFAVTVEVDGKRLGNLAYDGSLRYFVCEGNHRARISYTPQGGETEAHEFDFAVSRPSLFFLSQTSDCSGHPCRQEVGYELSPYEPDDLRVRVYPKER